MSFLQHFQLKPTRVDRVAIHIGAGTYRDHGTQRPWKRHCTQRPWKRHWGRAEKQPQQGGLGKGGARHSQKPRPDVGLLAEAMAPHIVLVKDLGAYEQIPWDGKAH